MSAADDLAAQQAERALLADARSHRRRNTPYCRSCVNGIERLSETVAELRAERDALATTVERVRWLAEAPDPDATDIYLHYAVQIDGAVHLAVLVDDLRAALAPPP